jgi:hypothetical protein
MNPAMPLAWISILVLILIVFGGLAAIIWRSWIVGSIVIVFVVLVVGMYMVRVSDVSSPVSSMAIVRESSGASIEHWDDAEMIKTADVYPSMDDAAKNLALRLYDQIQLIQPALSLKRVHIVSSAKVELRPIIGAVFRDKYPDAFVVDDDSHDGEVYDMTVKASLVDSDKTKRLALTATSKSGRNFNTDAGVIPAPWVNNLDQYRSDHPTGQWIVGWSTPAEPSRDLAKQQAREDAARQMLPFVTSKLPQLNPPNIDPQVLRNQLAQELLHRRFFKEEFVQKLHLPATGQSVYHAGILVDVGSPQLQKLQSSIIDDLHRSNARVRRFGGGVVGMGVVICLVYLFLNWATRGYFQMNLRLAAFLVLIAGVMLMMLIG